MALKRKNEESSPTSFKKRAIDDKEAELNFRKGLFDGEVLKKYQTAYITSQPYKHGVITDLLNQELLRKVRNEIKENISFTPKETDIYKIHQSGDLANLDGLDDESLRLLPSLLTLRDSMYSSAFRKYIASVTGSGPLSGVKTDMAVNVYTPGCHLLCHDDVIGSRRVSYILYLLDPDTPWKPEWGGALRLYPTEKRKDENGGEVKVPTPEFTVSIPPAFNQLSFFTVQPGESFHDVEEVYHRTEGTEADDGGRIRMAISGWFHIPQEGEEGYEEGLEETLAERSSLQQLQGKSVKFDKPQPRWKDYEDEEEEEDETDSETFSETEMEYLLKFMNPQYLTPENVERIRETFEEESVIRLPKILHPKFATRLHTYLTTIDGTDTPLPPNPSDTSASGIAGPPYKQRFEYRHTSNPSSNDPTPYDELVDSFFPSLTFRKWLALATRLPLSNANILARRFRRGKDYSLATSYDDDEPQLEVCLGITPTPGWSEEIDDEEEQQAQSEDEIPASNGTTNNGNSTKKDKKSTEAWEPVGGHELYMAADDDEDEDAGSNDGVEIPSGAAKGAGSHTGAGTRRKADPAIYRSSGAEDDDGLLFNMPALWNHMSIVLRDRGVLRFVKYVSKAAKGDRWDISGEFQVLPEEEEEEVGENEGDDGEESEEEEVEEEVEEDEDAEEEEDDD